MISCDVDNFKNHFSIELEAGHNNVFVRYIHMSLSTGNKVVFLKAMARLQNNGGEVSNDIVHKDRSALDSRP